MTVGFPDSAVYRITPRTCRSGPWRAGGRALPLLLALAACRSAGDDALAAPVGDRPPVPGAVRDGMGPDIDTQESRRAVFANWDAFTDPEGRAVVYQWSIGTAPGRPDVMPWTSTGGATAAAASGLDLQDGVLLFVSVRATDLRGNQSAASTSDGVRVGAGPAPGAAGRGPGTLTAVERFGTTWTFAAPVPCGRFVNGDWWVVGPVDVIAIDPASRSGARVRHGSMIDPDPRSDHQGYDSAMFGEHATGRYDARANVGLDVTTDRPLRLQPGCSLVSATSHGQPGQLPQLDSCAVLTVLQAPAPDDAFRPPYCGTDKTCRWRASQLDLSRLARLEAPDGAPLVGELAARFERTWLDHVPGWLGRFVHPRANMPDYGRDMADLVSLGALVLQLDLEDATKRPLAIHLTQLGIDCYGIVAAGGRFVADGGSGAGRKFPVLLAGTLLHDETLLRCIRDHKLAFAEDVQTFYVDETSPGVINGGHGGYVAADVGTAEWGNRHGDDPRLDDKVWTGDPYRRCCTASTWHGFVLATRMMRLQQAWGHEPLFDYVDRYMQIEPKHTWERSWNPFAERMWDRYRSSY